MEEDPREKTLNCKFDLYSWVVIIMHISCSRGEQEKQGNHIWFPFFF